MICHPETYSEPCQTSKMERFAKTVSAFYALAIFVKRSILHKFIICILNQAKREHIPINVLGFFLKDPSDEDCVFPGLKKFFACSQVFRLVVE